MSGPAPEDSARLGGRRIGQVLRASLGLCFQAAPRLSGLLLGVILLEGLAAVGSLYLIRQATDLLVQAVAEGGKGAAAAALGGKFLALLGVLLLQALLQGVHRHVAEVQGRRITELVCRDVFAKSLRLDLAEFERPEHFDALHRVLNEAPYRPPQIWQALGALAASLVVLAGTAYVVATVEWVVLPLLALLAVPGGLWGWAHVRQVHRHWREWTADSRRMEYFADVLGSARFAPVLRLLGIGPLFLERFRDLQRTLDRRRAHDHLQGSLREFGFAGLTLLGTFGLLWWVTGRALAGSVTAGGLMMLFQALRRLQAESKSLVDAGVQLFNNLLFLEQYVAFMEREERIEALVAAALPEPAPGVFRFEGVTFAYPGADRPALREIEVELAPGRSYALVGPNGSGKSTFVKLLTRLYDPDQGRVRLAGRDIREWPAAAYRRRFSVLPQSEGRFELTAAENIGLGDPAAGLDRERIRAAAARSGVLERLEVLPAGLDSPLGQEFAAGAELSPGEWQKLLLARAFYRPAPVLILDEPLATLDALAEAALIESLFAAPNGITRLIVSHRLATVRRVDTILVFRAGRIVEAGSFADLIRKDGEFARLYRPQAELYQL